MTWAPHLGAQTEFLRRTEFEVLFGGAAGPGKTDCLVAALAADIRHPRYRGLLVRRTFPQLQEIIDRCWRMYPLAGGHFRASEKRWEFPSGATIALGHMQHEDDKYNYQGAEFHRCGVDEVTQFTETQYTYLISRLRTTDPELHPQILSTTNPGGIGHYWVKERFVTITDHGRPYWDPKTGLSRVFIPAKIEDNPTLFETDPAYLQRLEALPEIERQRLRHGIWDTFEGQVFTELSQRLHGCEDFDIPPEWERFCVLDWGFSKPFSVGWYALDYDGILYRYREWYGCKKEVEGAADGADVGLKLQAWEVGKGILDREKGEKIRMRIADPTIWHPRPEKRRRESHGITIHEDMTSQGVYFIKADNDRTHGKMQVHKRLKVEVELDPETGEVVDEHPLVKVFNSCKGFWRTMPLLREDPRNPEEVDTDIEDHCFISDTSVCLYNGSRRIGDLVGTDGLVLSSSGRFERYRSCRLTRRNVPTVRVTFDDGTSVRCTPDHRFMLESGVWARAKNLSGLTIRSLSVRPVSNFAVSVIRYAASIFSGAASDYTAQCGKRTTALFQKASTSITSMGIARIIGSVISYFWMPVLMPRIMQTSLSVSSMPDGISSGSETRRQSGTVVQRASSGTKSSTSSIAQRNFTPLLRRSASSAERGSNPSNVPASVRMPARLLIGISLALMTWRVFALNVARSFARIATLNAKRALLNVAHGRAVEHAKRCINVSPAESADVYCLTVPKTSAFAIEGGLVVANCYDEFRYMCMARPVRPKKVERAPAGSFQAERSRLIRAKQYARRHGISVDVAYSRTR